MVRAGACCAASVVWLASLVALVVLFGNHGPVLPLGLFFPSGGVHLAPQASAYAPGSPIVAKAAADLVRGFVEPGYEGVRDALASSLAAGFDVGAGVSAYVDGREVVRLFGGSTEHGTFNESTLTPVFSSTKMVTSLAVAMLVDRGLLDYDETVCTYWREFCSGEAATSTAVAWRAKLTVRQLMQHQSGLHFLEPAVPLAQGTDAAMLAKQTPAWDPSSGRQAYNAMTRGLYVQQLFKATDGRSVGAFIRDEIAVPLGLDFSLGVPSRVAARVPPLHDTSLRYMLANVLPQSLLPTAVSEWLFGTPDQYPFTTMLHRDKELVKALLFRPDSISTRSVRCLHGKSSALSKLTRERAFLEKEFPSFNGVTSAQSLARIGAVLAQGGAAFGVTLLSPDGAAQANDVSGGPRYDEGLFRNMTYSAAGFGFDRFGPGVYGWGGAGGSVFVWSPTDRFSMAFVPNLMAARLSKVRGERLLAALQHAIAAAPSPTAEVPSEAPSPTAQVPAEAPASPEVPSEAPSSTEAASSAEAPTPAAEVPSSPEAVSSPEAPPSSEVPPSAAAETQAPSEASHGEL